MRSLFVVAVLTGLSGCASIVSGSNQSVSVKTIGNNEDVMGSKCSVTNNKGTWFVTTPGSVMVHRSYEPLNIKCDHKGYVSNATSTESATRALAFGNILLGLLGGPIGAGVDIGNGAAYDYPNPIVVPLTPEKVAKSDGAPTS